MQATPPASEFSAVVLTKNEEQDIRGCLESLGQVGDLHVLDSGSTDQTCLIAAQLGAQVHTHVPDGDFRISDQRNWALTNLPLKYPWVLFLDADERADAAFLDAVRRATSAGGFDAYYCAPRFIYMGRWLRWAKPFPDWHPRVAKRGQAPFAGGVWEDFSEAVDRGYIEAPYDHYPDSKGLSAWVEKHLRYADWEADRTLQVSQGDSDLRRGLARNLAFRAHGMRPWLVWLGTLTVRRAALEGRPGRSYARRILIYELLIQETLLERREASRPKTPE